MLLQIGPRHQARGPNASTKVEPANDRPSPRSVLIQTSTQLMTRGHRAGFRRQTETAGPLPFKAKEFVLMLSECGAVLVLGRGPQAPEVMLDDVVQACPGRHRPNDSEEPPRWQLHYGQQRARLAGR